MEISKSFFQMKNNSKPSEIGIVGLGLMGCNVVAALLIKNNFVVGLAPVASDMALADSKIRYYLEEAYSNDFSDFTPDECLERFILVEDYAALKNCELVLECVTENIEIKKSVYQQIEKNIDKNAILATNTSALPITILQEFTQYPNRFMGMHWAEPAFTTKFLEIVCGPKTDISLAEGLYQKAHEWGKEPTLVRKDIRGFITNRIMYAMYREAFYLVENGYATIEDVDRSCRNDGGHWMTFCGLFRYMDITGLQAYYKVMSDLFPSLNNQTEVPKSIKKIAENGGNGITNGNGFYQYTKEEAEEWEQAYQEFAFDISRLSAKYPFDFIEKRLEEKRLIEQI